MEPDAFTLLYTSSYRTIVRFIFLRVNDRTLAEDLTAETFAIAWEKSRTGIPIDLRWLFTTARNLIGNEYQRRDRDRARARHPALEKLVSMETWDVEIGNVDLRLAMSQLRPLDAIVLQLTYWDGLSARDVAAFLGSSAAAVWVRLTRARATLRALLEDPEAPPTMPVTGGETHG